MKSTPGREVCPGRARSQLLQRAGRCLAVTQIRAADPHRRRCRRSPPRWPVRPGAAPGAAITGRRICPGRARSRRRHRAGHRSKAHLSPGVLFNPGPVPATETIECVHVSPSPWPSAPGAAPGRSRMKSTPGREVCPGCARSRRRHRAGHRSKDHLSPGVLFNPGPVPATAITECVHVSPFPWPSAPGAAPERSRMKSTPEREVCPGRARSQLLQRAGRCLAVTQIRAADPHRRRCRRSPPRWPARPGAAARRTIDKTANRSTAALDHGRPVA